MEQRTASLNIKYSKDVAHEVQRFMLSSNNKLVKNIDQQIQKCKEQIKMLIESDKELKSKVDELLTIMGIVLITAATIIAEPLGFEQVKNGKQLVSYAGYDVVES